jgi:hypothetical protein
MAQNPRRAADVLPNTATHRQFLRSQAARHDAASSSGQGSGHGPCHGDESKAAQSLASQSFVPQRGGTNDSLFATPAGVISMLRRYRDVFDPRTTSLLLVSRQGFDPSQGPFRAGFLSRLDEREELRQRMTDRLAERERKLLFLWYVVELRPCDVARTIRVSRVHAYRLRNDALAALCDGEAPGGRDALPSPPGGRGAR